MAQVNLPMTLSVAYWDKQKAALAKATKAPTTKLPDELKQLSKLHLGVDWDAFGADKLKTGDEVESRLDDLDDAVKGKIKTLLAQVQAVDKSATSFETDAKKDKAFPKEPLAAATAIVKSAREYRADVDAAVDAARKALETKAKEFAQKSSGGASNPALGKQTKLLKSRLLTAIATLRKPLPNARPMRFMIVLSSKASSGLALGYAVGPAQEKLLKGLMPGEGPFKIMKDMKAVVVWEKNALTFVSDRLPGTVIKKVQLWLKKLLKLNLKMRVRKSSGEVEETEGGEDISDDMLKVDPADAEAAVGKEEFTERFGSLQSAIKAGLTGPAAARLKELMASITKLTKADKYDDADGELDEIEALLSVPDGDEDDEVEVEEAASQEDDKADAEAAFKKRFATLQPGVKAALAGPEAARLKELVAGITQLAKAGKFADAGKVLDGIEKLLKGGSGGGGSGSGSGGSGDDSGKSAADAMDEWKTRRAAAVTSLKSVATKVAGAKHASSAKAIVELQAVIKNLTAEPSTLQQVKELQQWLTNDDVVNDVCELDQDIRTPLLGALGKLREALAA
jgi:hypothetical protein